jgi:hypothetical protein
MRITIFALICTLALAARAGADEPPPSNGAPAPQLDIERTGRINHYQSLSRGLGIGGRVGLGVGIPFLVIGITLDVLANVSGGAYLCTLGCDVGGAAGAGYFFTGLGIVALGGGVTMLVLSGVYRGKAERLRAGQVALDLVPRLQLVAHAGGRGSDGMTASWRLTF